MNAAIDLGNTFGKLAFFEGLTLTNYERGLDVEGIIQSLKKVNPEKIIICSVTKNSSELNELFYNFKNKLILSSDTILPIKNGYKTPKTLGYDRIAAAVGAFYQYPKQNCLIIEMGTAIKYDYLSKSGTFEGGIISPGLRMRFKALHTFTKKLPLIKEDGIPALIGTSTESCIRSGVVNGMAAEINGLISKYQEKEDLKIIIGGGDAVFFESQINYPTFAASNLVLEGLNRILIYNAENKNFIK